MSRDLSFHGALAAAAGCILAAGALELGNRGGRFGLLLLVGALVFASAARTGAKWNRLRNDPLCEAAARGERVWVTGVVVDEPEFFPDGSRRFRLRVRQFWSGKTPDHGQASRALLLVMIRRWVNVPVHRGDELLFRTRLLPFTGPRNPGDVDRRRYWFSQNTVARCSISSETQIVHSEPSEARTIGVAIFGPFQRWASVALYRLFPIREASLLEGLILGRRSMIEPELRDRFAELGVVHILAVSGLHVGYVAGGLLFLLSSLRLPRRMMWPALILGLFVYAGITGGKPPVVRASLMASSIVLAEALQRRYDAINGLSFAGCVILLRNPLEMFQLGFQLSFAAVLAIVVIFPKVRSAFPDSWKRHAPLRWLRDLLSVSLAAQVGTLPLTLLVFGRLPVWGAVANLFVVPAAGLAVALGFLTLAAQALVPLGAGILASACWKTLLVLEGFVTFADRLGLKSVEVSGPAQWLVVATAGIGILCLLVPRTWRLRLALFGGLVVANAWVWAGVFAQRATDVIFLDVGLGDAALVRLADGRAMLIDAGDARAEYDYGARVVLPTLRRLGVTKLEAVIVSHGHQDHVGGLPAVLRRMPVRRVLWNGIPSDAAGWTVVRHLADSLRIPVQALAAGDTVGGFDPALVLVLGPRPSGAGRGQNDNSIVLLIRVFGRLLLFTGDAERAEERQVLRFAELLDVDVLKVAHHGSATSTGREFLAVTRPEIAVISTSRFNRFGFPSRETLSRLEAAGCKVLQTAEDGAVWLRVERSGELRVIDW